MKGSTALSFFLLAFAALSLAETTENQIRVTFNNGVIAPGLSCDASDTLQLSKTIDRHRFLRADAHQDTETNQQRKLQATFYPASCKTTCAGFLPGTCLAQSCRGFRRELDAVETTAGAKYDQDRVLRSEWCALAMKHADNYLDAIIKANKVSGSCAKLLKTTRQMDCMIVTC
jgi:hypothetical protein